VEACLWCEFRQGKEGIDIIGEMAVEVPLHCTKIVGVIEGVACFGAKVRVYPGRDEWALVSKRYD
jgi:hypothetical protein